MQRVVHRAAHRRSDRHIADLADGFRAERALLRTSVLQKLHADVRQVVCKEQMIFGQTLRAAAVLLHGHLFAQRSAAAHLHRALDLRLAEAGVDGLTDVVHGEIVEHLRKARPGVDLDMGEVRARHAGVRHVRIARAGRQVAGVGVHALFGELGKRKKRLVLPHAKNMAVV